MIRSEIVVLFALVFSASVLPARAQWTPPIGIPAPSFGIVETARAVPSPWTTATAGFYYVNATHAASTDSSNPYGTPAKPRKTIPNSLPAGAVVELHGTYDRLHTSPNTIVANGTAAAPVFIRGASQAAMPLIRASWELSGSYVILENLEFGPLDATRSGEVVMLAPLHHASLRHSNLHGNLETGGLGIVSWSSALTQHIVVYNNSIHDNGNVNATYDQDVHGIVVSARVSHLWVVDNRLYRNSGDGIQINAGSTANQSTTHHIYVGRNTAYNNKQTGMWAKQAVDVIFSQNRCYGHRPSNSSMGMCMGYQYATERMWFLYNVISDSEFGIGVGSNHDGVGVDAAFVGNIIYNIHHSGTGYNPSTAWSSAGIMLAGGQYARIVNNTIFNVDAGINVPAALSTLEVADNIIGQVTVAASNHVFVEDAGLVSRMSMHHNLFEGTPRTRLAGSQKVLTAAQLAASWSLNGSPAFVNASGGDYRLQSSSLAIDRGEAANPVYASFQQRYGLSIARDPYGTVRPTGAAIDMGGFEYTGCGAQQPPVAPTALTATVSGQSLSLQWTQPASCGPATNYVLEAGSSPGLSNLGTWKTGNTATTFTDSNVASGTYHIRVKAENAAGTSAASNEVTAAVGVPGPPRNLTGSVSGSVISLSWQAPILGTAPTGYVIEIGTAAGRTDLTKSVPVSLAFAGTAVRGTYYIRVRAITIAAVGAASNEVTVVVN